MTEVGPPHRRRRIVGYAYRCLTRDVRNERLDMVAEIAFEGTNCRQAIVIAVDVDSPGRPYDCMALLEQDEQGSTP